MKVPAKHSGLIAMFLIGIIAPVNATAQTMVGNGGDTVDAFLQKTRRVLIDTYQLMRDNRTQLENESPICNDAALNAAQKTQCRQFVWESLTQILDLNNVDKPTPFLIRSEPLFAEGPDGNPRPVAARTQLGPAGPVEFHYDSIRLYSPARMLLLLTHELLHKVEFGGRYVGDNDDAGAFASGREFVDAAATAVVGYARDNAFVGEGFALFDYFYCEIRNGQNGNLTGAAGMSQRWFFGGADLNFDRYETTLGHKPTDMRIFTAYDGGRLHYRLRILEPNGCALPEAGRISMVELVHVADKRASSSVVSTRELAGYNPVCEKRTEWLSIAYGVMELRCKYEGSYTVFK